MRKERLWIENKFLEWIIYSFYRFFGGYTQNFKIPLGFWLLCTLLIFPTYYFLFEGVSQTSYGYYKIETVKNAYEKSLTNAIPILKSNLNFNNWWIKSIQIFFSSLFLTFFVLALRK